MQTRVYVVIDSRAKQPRLIRAANRAHALRYAAKDVLTAVVPTREHLIELMQAGVKVEDPTHAAA